eukprot:gnl/MRDRNA2_/MRDRNA2_71132_c0_seq1.p1 gnl/MRDRNA2_/MRDRNA2_71132_c0~~gnl/MRDRNA2_/MRDRNA2_71132_c0_seq1.p1  ORF type:complete len:701 (+),score=161.14 gnl/MRDRNA2_/MRDRNA2_71132_c0_seq1:93-2195(+)
MGNCVAKDKDSESDKPLLDSKGGNRDVSSERFSSLANDIEKLELKRAELLKDIEKLEAKKGFADVAPPKVKTSPKSATKASKKIKRMPTDAFESASEGEADNSSAPQKHVDRPAFLAAKSLGNLVNGEGTDEAVPEFLNEALEHMWPFISEFVADTLRNTVEPAIQNALPVVGKGLHFSRQEKECNLGSEPISFKRMSSIKATQGNRTNLKIIAEMDYEGDCNIILRLASASVGVSKLRILGTMVIELVLLKPAAPMFSGLRIYFANPPRLDLDIAGNLGVALSLGVIKKTILGVVEQAVCGAVVLPNRIAVPLDPDINVFRIKSPRPAGILRVAVLEAKGLAAVDTSRWSSTVSSDPYCQITCGAEIWRTPTIKTELNPKWADAGGNVKDFVVTDMDSQALIIEIYDEDYTWTGSATQSDMLGQIVLSFKDVVNAGKEGWWKLKPGDGESQVDRAGDLGSVKLQAEWRPFRSATDSHGKPPLQDRWTVHNADTDEVSALFFMGLYGSEDLPPAPQGTQYWASVTCTGRKDSEEERETPKVLGISEAHGSLGSDEQIDDKHDKLRKRVDLLQKANVPPEITAEVLNISVRNVTAHIERRDSAKWEDKQRAVWEAPMMFFLSDLKTAECTIKVWQNDGSGPKLIGSSNYHVSDLTLLPKNTTVLEMDLETEEKHKGGADLPSVKVFFQLRYLGARVDKLGA